MTTREWLDGLKVGDEVVRMSHGFGGVRTLEIIESISGTKRRIITLLSGERFNGNTGRKQDKSGAWDRISGPPVIMEATPEFKADLERRQRFSRARSCLGEAFSKIKEAEDPTAIEAAAAALEAILHPVPPLLPQLISRDDLAAAWNEDADHFNRWDSLSDEEQLEWAQLRAIARDRARRQGEAD